MGVAPSEAEAVGEPERAAEIDGEAINLDVERVADEEQFVTPEEPIKVPRRSTRV